MARGLRLPARPAGRRRPRRHPAQRGADRAFPAIGRGGQPIDQAIVQAAIGFLSNRQRADGSWEGSVYKTALAAAALQTFLLPDPFIDPGEALADPAAPYLDEPATLLAAVRNGGTFLAAGTEYAWEFTRRGEPAPRFQLKGTLPALAEVGFFTVEQTLCPASCRPATTTCAS